MTDDSPFQKPKAGSKPFGDSQTPTNPSSPQDSPAAEAKQKKLQSLLAGLWERSRQTIIERIETLQQARFLAAANKLDEPARLRAVDSAHKLAGVLGTFGLPHGTELAREAEEVFGRRTIIAPADLERLSALLDDLASLVETAEAYPGVDPGSQQQG